MVQIDELSFKNKCEMFQFFNSNIDFINIWIKQLIKINLQKKKINKS